MSEIGRMRAAAKRIVPMINKARPTDGLDLNTDAASLVARAFAVTSHTKVTPLFDPVTFTVAQGETVALTGRSGTREPLPRGCGVASRTTGIAGAG